MQPDPVEEAAMRRLSFLTLSLGLALTVSGACGDDDSSSKTPAASTTTATTPAATATSAAASATAATKPATTPPADGTVDPLNPGQQTPWTVKSNPDPFNGVATVNALRMGVHPELGGWERIVFEFAGPQLPPATVQYVTKATSCGSGQPATVGGTAIFEVAITSAQAHDAQGMATLPAQMTGAGGTVIVGGLSTCDFEGHVTWDFGFNGKHNFKVTTLTGPTRLVIDIKQ
jgi:hypothetical protein